MNRRHLTTLFVPKSATHYDVMHTSKARYNNRVCHHSAATRDLIMTQAGQAHSIQRDHITSRGNCRPNRGATLLRVRKVVRGLITPLYVRSDTASQGS